MTWWNSINILAAIACWLSASNALLAGYRVIGWTLIALSAANGAIIATKLL